MNLRVVHIQDIAWYKSRKFDIGVEQEMKSEKLIQSVLSTSRSKFSCLCLIKF